MIIRDWKKPWRMVGNSSVYRFNVGYQTYPHLLEYFEQNFEKIRKEVRHEQAFLSNYSQRTSPFRILGFILVRKL